MAGLDGVQRLILQAIIDSPKDPAGFVTDDQIALSTGMAVPDVRNGIETLDEDHLVEVARMIDRLSVAINARGKLAWGRYQPFPSTAHTSDQSARSGLMIRDLTDETGGMVSTARDSRGSLDADKLHRLLSFVQKVVAVVEESSDEILTILEGFEGVTPILTAEDVAGLVARVDDLYNRRWWKDAKGICARLKALGVEYQAQVEPIIRSLPDKNRWPGAFRLLHEHEGEVVRLAQGTVNELRSLLRGVPDESTASRIRAIARDRREEFERAIETLQAQSLELQALSGDVGFDMLTRD